MTHKKVNNADAGTADLFGGNDGDKWSDYASGVDVDDYDINSDTAYRYDKFQIRNSANTFGHKHRSNATAARTITYPDASITIPERTASSNWTIYKAGTIYKAMNSDSSIAGYSGANLKADVWDWIVANPGTSNNHIHFLNASTPYDIEAGVSLEIGAGGFDCSVTGESMRGVKIRPLSNTICMAFTNVRRFVLDNLSIYVDQGTAYTQDAIRLIASAGGCETVLFKNLYLRQDAGTSAITQGGRGIVMLLTGANPSISWFDCRDIMVQGFAAAYKLATFAVTNPAGTVAAWSNENSFFRCNSQHSKLFFQAGTLLAADQLWSWHWKDCGWQTTGGGVGADATQDDMFDIDVFGACLALCRNWHLEDCIMWDPFSNVTKFFKANTNCRVLLHGGGAAPGGFDGLGDQWMGGAGFNAATGTWNTGAYVERESANAESRGATSIGDGGAITHRLLTTPKHIILTPTIAGTIASVTAASSTTFTVALKTPSGTTPFTTPAATQIVYWRAREYF